MCGCGLVFNLVFSPMYILVCTYRGSVCILWMMDTSPTWNGCLSLPQPTSTPPLPPLHMGMGRDAAPLRVQESQLKTAPKLQPQRCILPASLPPSEGPRNTCDAGPRLQCLFFSCVFFSPVLSGGWLFPRMRVPGPWQTQRRSCPLQGNVLSCRPSEQHRGICACIDWKGGHYGAGWIAEAACFLLRCAGGDGPARGGEWNRCLDSRRCNLWGLRHAL